MIEFQSVYKKYAEKEVLCNINLKINKGEMITVLGPSGCGKTTLLKLVNKLLLPDSGQVTVNNNNINDVDEIQLRRSIGYVIQQLGLFPHLTVEDNITYVLNLEKRNRQERRNKAEVLIEKMGLDKSYLPKYPDELSGGEKQRVGVARAFAGEQDIILMDEPFGAVDELQKGRLQDDLMLMQSRENKTIMFVTHDIFEAFRLGDRIVLMNEGVIQQAATPQEFLEAPANNFVREFLGVKGFLASLEKSDIDTLRKQIKSRSEQY